MSHWHYAHQFKVYAGRGYVQDTQSSLEFLYTYSKVYPYKYELGSVLGSISSNAYAKAPI